MNAQSPPDHTTLVISLPNWLADELCALADHGGRPVSEQALLMLLNSYRQEAAARRRLEADTATALEPGEDEERARVTVGDADRRV